MAFSGSWEIIGAEGFSTGDTTFPALAFSPSGAPYVAYQDMDSGYNKTTVKALEGGAWVTVPVGGECFSTGEASDITMAFDSTGTPYVAYSDFNIVPIGGAVVMKYTGSAWIAVGTAGFSTGYASYTSIAVSPEDQLYIAYSDGSTSPINKACVKRFNSTSLIWEDVGTPGFSMGSAASTTLAFSPRGIPYVAYNDAYYDGKATVMRYVNDTWTDVGAPGFSDGLASVMSLAISPGGEVYIAYQDAATTPVNRVTVRKFDGKGWVNVGNPGFSPTAAQYIAMDLDSKGIPYVGYRNSDNMKANVMVFR
jgi:hypothetical protein